MPVAITDVHSGTPEYAVITNLGSEEVDLKGYVLNAGDDGQDFTFPDDAKLAPGASFKVYTNKSPLEPGEYSYDSKRPIWNNAGDIGVLRDGGGHPVSTNSYGKRHIPPQIEVTPTSLSFASLEVGQAGTERQLTIRNKGGSDLRLNGDPLAELAGANPGDWTVVTPPDPTIPPNGSTGLTVRFSPTAEGSRSAELRIASNDPATSSASVALDGEAIARAHFALEASPALVGGAHDFGEVAADGGAKVLTCTVRNAGRAPLDISAVTLRGSTGSYQVSGPSPTTIEPNKTAQYEVTFDPNSGGQKPATLQIDYDEGNGPQTEQVGLMGVGTGPEIGVMEVGLGIFHEAMNHDFGDLSAGQSSAPAKFEILNSGKAPLLLDDKTPIRIEGGDGTFELSTPPATTTVPPNGHVEFEVIFVGGQPGEHHGTIEISSNDADENPYRIDVRGRVKRTLAGAARALAITVHGNGLALIACMSDGSVRTRPYLQTWWGSVSGLSGVVGVYGHGYNAGHAVDSDGKLWRVGHGTPLIDGGVIDAAVGKSHVLALMDDGTVWAAGDNTFSQCGKGAARANGFNEVDGVSDIVQLAASRFCSLALRADGSVWHWGAFGYSRQGDPTPQQNWGLSGVESISVNTHINSDGHYFAQIGRTVYGLGYRQNISPQYFHCQAPGTLKSVSTDANQTSGFLLLENGSVWSKGKNDMYRLGHGGWWTQVPMGQLSGLPKIRAVLCQTHAGAAIGEDGRIYEWGMIYPRFRGGAERFAATPRATL